jgi:drug/metabolite transporter (DMT)-like permease
VELWIPITVAAALLQCTRTALQQKLKALLSTNGANFVRYFYGAPVSILMLVLLMTVGGRTLPQWDWVFVAWAALGGVAQIIATSLLIYSFELRNFAVGTAYSKTETVQLALVAVLVLGESLGLLAWIGIIVSLLGVVMLSVKGDTRTLREIALGWTHKAALVGIAAGGIFGIAAVSIRQGALHLPGGDFMIRAIFTLAVMNTLQTLIMSAWLLARERDQLVKVATTWRSSALVGLLSVFGSACWAMGFALQSAAYIRALGQVELVFTFIASRYMLHERPTVGELVSAALVVGGVVLVLLGR